MESTTCVHRWPGPDLAKRLSAFEYVVTRQTGSHMRLTTQRNGEHHVTITHLHKPLRVGTLNGILSDVAAHLGMPKAAVGEMIFK